MATREGDGDTNVLLQCCYIFILICYFSSLSITYVRNALAWSDWPEAVLVEACSGESEIRFKKSSLSDRCVSLKAYQTPKAVKQFVTPRDRIWKVIKAATF